MHSKLLIALLFCIFFGSISLYTQEIIHLKNPSFEGEPRHSMLPPDWQDSGFKGQSRPDTQPSGDFGVYKPASHGKTYIGMVVRENDTYESITQKLTTPLQAGTCYQMEVAVARSEKYMSPTSSRPDTFTNYDTPCMLRILGERTEGAGIELLAEIGPIKSYEWEYYLVDLVPSADCIYIRIEAFYETPVRLPYNGNILVDDLSPIVPCKLLKEGMFPRDFEKEDP